jgi:Fe-S cluster assembly ATPase SufC
MKRIAVFTLLLALGVAWSVPAKAQGISVAEYERQSQEAAKKQQKMFKKAAKKQRKMSRKAVKKQRKAMKKYEKAQRKQVKKVNRHGRL